MRKVALHNLGCKVNSYELDVIGQKLEEKGYIIVPFDETADIYIINTCTVTNMADRKSRQMLHQAKKRNPEAIVVAVGCYVQTGMEQVLLDAGIDLAVGNNKKKDLVEILEAYLADKDGEGTFSKTMNDTSVIDINATFDMRKCSLPIPRSIPEHTLKCRTAAISFVLIVLFHMLGEGFAVVIWTAFGRKLQGLQRRATRKLY